MVSKALMSASEAVGTGRCLIEGRTVLSAVRERGWWVSGLLPCFIILVISNPN